jgi:hypothetical protein
LHNKLKESQIHLGLCGKQKNILSSTAENPAPVFQSAASHIVYNVFEECKLQQKKRQVPLQFDAYLHTQDCKVWQAGSKAATIPTNILPPYSAQTPQHRANILLQKLPLNFTASLPGRHKSLQTLP